VIGASDTPKRPNTSMTVKIRTWAAAHAATVYLVNPNRDSVDGEPCYPSIADVPVDVDLPRSLSATPSPSCPR
jgi:acetate---CoA ligase (ADP-forming)